MPLYYKDFDYFRQVGVKDMAAHLIELCEKLGFSYVGLNSQQVQIPGGSGLQQRNFN